MTTKLTSFTISDILRETRHCHDDDVTDDVISGSRRPVSLLMQTADERAAATGDYLLAWF